MTVKDQNEKSIAEITDWRGGFLTKLRTIINKNPDVTEDRKWDVPVWTSNGMVCAISAFKDHVKINFFKGASFENKKVFNSGLESKSHRSINFSESDKIDEKLIEALVKEGVSLNLKKK